MTQRHRLFCFIVTKYPLHHFYFNPQDLSAVCIREGAHSYLKNLASEETLSVPVPVGSSIGTLRVSQMIHEHISGLLTIDSRNQAFVQQIWANCVLSRRPNLKLNQKPNWKPNRKPKIKICCSTLEYNHSFQSKLWIPNAIDIVWIVIWLKIVQMMFTEHYFHLWTNWQTPRRKNEWCIPV